MVLTPPTGVAKLFYVIGLLVGFAGMAMFMFPLVTTIAEGFAMASNPNPARFAEMPDFSRVSEAMPLAFRLAIPGMIVAALASAIGPHPTPDIDVQVGHRFGDHATFSDRGGYIDMRYRQDTHITHLNVVALNEIASIRAVLSQLGLPARARHEIEQYLGEAQRELSGRQPNMDQVGDRLARATQLMRRVGAFAHAGGELVPRLTHLGLILGNAGSILLRMLQ